jgi:hypothetical protein
LIALVADHPDLGADALGVFEPGESVNRRTTRGGGGPAAVAQQLVRFAARRAEIDQQLSALRS